MPITREPKPTRELSHLRVKVTTAREIGQVYAKDAHRKTADGGWRRMYTDGLIRAKDREELQEKLEEWNERARHRMLDHEMRRARRHREQQLRSQRRKKARAEYKEWLNTLPVSADWYKEDPDRLRYTGGPDGRTEKRSFTDWADKKALEKWPEKTRSMKAEIRKRYDLYEGTMLI